MATSTLSGSDVGGRGPPRARRSLSAALRFAQRGRLKWLLCCLLCKAQLFPFQGRALWKVASAQKSACDPSMREPLQRQQWGHRKTPCCPLPSRHTASVRLAALPSPPPQGSSDHSCHCFQGHPRARSSPLLFITVYFWANRL